MILVLEGLPSYSVTLAVIAAMIGFSKAKLHMVLRALQSVTEIWNEPIFDDADDNETNIQWVILSHQSFHDFLTNRGQSRQYFIDKELFVGQVLCHTLELATTSTKELKGCRR